MRGVTKDTFHYKYTSIIILLYCCCDPSLIPAMASANIVNEMIVAKKPMMQSTMLLRHGSSHAGNALTELMLPSRLNMP